MRPQEPAVPYRKDCCKGPVGSAPVQLVQVFLGCDLMRGFNGDDASSPPDKRQHVNSTSPTRSNDSEEQTIIVDEWLDNLRTQNEAHGVDFVGLKLKMANPAVDLLDASLSILNGIPRDQLQGALGLTWKEYGFLCNCLTEHFCKKSSKKQARR